MKYDILIVGSGPGGYVAAIRAAQLGRRVALVERAEAGGVCLNWGCIPTKALLKSAQVYGYCRNAGHYGLELTGEVRPDPEKIVARSRGVAETMSKGVQFLLRKNNIDLIPGFGRLTAPGRLDVEGTTYEADHIILATGARPRELPFLPADGEHIVTSREALTLGRLPESLVVVGSGAIGSEFAWFYATLGVRVTVVEYLPRMLPLEDEEVSKAMERSFRKLRAAVLTSTTVKGVKITSEGMCEVEIEGRKGPETLVAEKVLSAVGIQANIEGIGLEELGVAVERGKVTVDPYYRTSVPGIYAIGDIIGGYMLAHAATFQGIRALNHIMGTPDKLNLNVMPAAVFTMPEAATVGLTEDECKEKGIACTCKKSFFRANGKAVCLDETDGFCKLVVGDDGKLLGCHLFGPHAADLVQEVCALISVGATLDDLQNIIHTHPTLGEVIQTAAHS